MPSHKRTRTLLILAIFITLTALAAYWYFAQSGKVYINPQGLTIQARITLPKGYTRIAAAPGSFAEYLRTLRLKPDGSIVHYYNGQTKRSMGVYLAVVDLPIGNKNLHQCADAVMHLRADYLFKTHQQDKIHFTFTNGFRADYSKWAQGNRIVISGNKAEWKKTALPDTSYACFSAYMDVIYNYCGSLSLSRELKPVSYTGLQPGDVLVKGGTPGHVEIITDVAQNAKGEKIYLLAQSSMPAQEIQLLINPLHRSISPWYEVDRADKRIVTPEFIFNTGQLMRFDTT